MGNKTCLLDQILPLLPYKMPGFCEVFGGSGALTFSTPTLGQEKEIYNDFNRDLVNFMLVLREQRYQLVFELFNFPMNSATEFNIVYKIFNPESIHSIQEREDVERYVDVVLHGSEVEKELKAAKFMLAEDDYESLEAALKGRASLFNVHRAAAFYKLQRYSYGSGGRNYGSRFINIIDYLKDILWCSQRLRRVVIQNKDFEALIKQYDSPDMFFFCDPPYHTTEDVYDVEFPESDHTRLRDTLKAIQGRCMVTYNDDQFIRDLYSSPGFWIIPVERPNSLSNKKDAVFKELIILNYDPNVTGAPEQLSLMEVSNEQ